MQYVNVLASQAQSIMNSPWWAVIPPDPYTNTRVGTVALPVLGLLGYWYRSPINQAMKDFVDPPEKRRAREEKEKQNRVDLKKVAQKSFSDLFSKCGLSSKDFSPEGKFNPFCSDLSVLKGAAKEKLAETSKEKISEIESAKKSCTAAKDKFSELIIRSLWVGFIYKNILFSPVGDSAFYENCSKNTEEFREAIFTKITEDLSKEEEMPYFVKSLKFFACRLVCEISGFFEGFITGKIDEIYTQVFGLVEDLRKSQKKDGAQAALLNQVSRFLRTLNINYAEASTLMDTRFKGLSLEEGVATLLSEESAHGKTEKEFVLQLMELFIQQLCGGSIIGYIPAKLGSLVLSGSGILDGLCNNLEHMEDVDSKKSVSYAINSCLSGVLIGLRGTLLDQSPSEVVPEISKEEKQALKSLLTVLTNTLSIINCNHDNKEEVERVIQQGKSSFVDKWLVNPQIEKGLDSQSAQVIKIMNDFLTSESVFELSQKGIESMSKLLIEKTNPKTNPEEDSEEEKKKIEQDKKDKLQAEKLVDGLCEEILRKLVSQVTNSVSNSVSGEKKPLDNPIQNLIDDLKQFSYEYEFYEGKAQKKNLYKKFVADCYEKEKKLRKELNLLEAYSEFWLSQEKEDPTLSKDLKENAFAALKKHAVESKKEKESKRSSNSEVSADLPVETKLPKTVDKKTEEAFRAYVTISSILKKAEDPENIEANVLQELKDYSEGLQRKQMTEKRIIEPWVESLIKDKYLDAFFELLRKPLVWRYGLRYTLGSK